MNKLQQKKAVISLIRTWKNSDEEAYLWFEEEFISALGCTPSSAIDSGRFDAVVDYLESIGHGGYA